MACHFQLMSITSFRQGYSFDNLDEGSPNEYSTVVKNLMFVSSFPHHPVIHVLDVL
jgi:hypothetical protein